MAFCRRFRDNFYLVGYGGVRLIDDSARDVTRLDITENDTDIVSEGDFILKRVPQIQILENLFSVLTDGNRSVTERDTFNIGICDILKLVSPRSDPFGTIRTTLLTSKSKR